MSSKVTVTLTDYRKPSNKDGDDEYETMIFEDATATMHANIGIVVTAKANSERAFDETHFYPAHRLIEVVSLDDPANSETTIKQIPEYNGLIYKEIIMLRNSCAIDAIKEVRARKNIGLKEAKDLVDEFRAKYGQYAENFSNL